MFSLEKQMNWAFMCIFRASIKSSNELRKRKNVIVLRQLIELKNTTYKFQYNRDMKIGFHQQLKLRTASCRINKRTNQTFFVEKIPSLPLLNHCLIMYR